MSKTYPFLDLLERKLDDHQSKALETVKNAVIAAGAGSGKTQVLASRFAWLVITGQAKADEILTLTFTNKAASEMYQRIYDTLYFFANHEICNELSEKQRELAQQGLSDFANAHIQTLDSYCSSVVRQCSNRYGIKPDFSVGSSDGERDVKNRAFKYTLKNATRLGISTFTDSGKHQDFAYDKLAYAINNCANITTPKNYFSSKLPVQTKIIAEAFNFYFADSEMENSDFPGSKNLKKIGQNIADTFVAHFDPGKHAVYRETSDKAFNFASANLFGIKISAEDIENNSESFQKHISNIQQFLDLIKQVRSIGKGTLRKVQVIYTQMSNTTIPALQGILSYAIQYEALKDLYLCFDEFLEEVNSSKRQSGNLTFGDVSELALKILIENPDIREQEIGSYKKIMIDEFQDNNGKNRDLLYLLALKPGTELKINEPLYSQIIIKNEDEIIEDKRSPEKLFFVGDEKQSIYKFRGADVSVFNELTSCNENQLISMTYNYRSKPETVKAFNLLFANGAGIFGTPDNPLDYEAYYNNDAMKNGVDLCALDLTAENVPFHFHFIDQKKLKNENESIENPLAKYLPPEEQIGYNIACKIYELGKENKNWSDFAILDKSRTHRSSITKFLSLFNIPYEMDQFSNIFEDGLVNDFYNFLRICVYPSDINSYAAFLCSPLCGLTENSVEIILSHLTNITDYNYVFDPFADFDKGIKADLSETQYQKYEKALNFYRENKKLVLQQKLTTTMDLLWNKLGYKYETMLNSQVDLCAEHFDMIFELARTCDEGNKSAAWFIDQLANLKSQWSQDDSDLDAANINYPLERSQAVQIMTIHKSKGLQFEHVFLCGCTSVSSKGEKASVFFDEKTGVSISTEKGVKNYFCYSQSELEKLKELAEFRRLIYVGITRAINDVYVMGVWREDTNSQSILRLFENMLKSNYGANLSEPKAYTPGLPMDYVNIAPVTYLNINHSTNSISVDQQRSNKMQLISQAFEKAETIDVQDNSIPRSCPSDLEKGKSDDKLKDSLRQENPEESQLRTVEFTAADFGVLVHSWLEAYANGIGAEEYQPETKLFKNLEGKELESVKKQCIDFVKLFGTTEEGKELDDCKKSGRFFRAEWGFKMFWDKTLWTGSIDLIYEKPDGTFQIIDYKSDEKIDAQKYEGQQNCYRVAAAKLLGIPENKIDCKLWFMKSNAVISLKPGDHQ